jgi:hypothetical protein
MHPLTHRLEICIEFLEHTGGGPTELVRRIKGVKGDNPIYGPHGVEIRSGSSSYFEFTGIPDTRLLLGLTLQWRGIVAASNLKHFAGKHLSNGGTNNPFDFRTDGGTNLVCVRADGTFSQTDNGSAITLNKLQTYTYLDPRPNTSRNREFWINGIKKTTGSGASSLSVTGSSTTLRIGRRADGAVQMNGKCQYFRAWGRGLTGTEIRWLEEEPYAIFNFPVKRTYVVLSGDSGSLNANASDTLNSWSDSASVILLAGPALSVEAFDSMFYNIFDEFTYGSSLTNIISSDQMSMSDSVTVTSLRQDLFFGDSFSLVDSINLSLLSNRAFADSMSMSDSLLMSSNMLLGVGDSLNFWSDAGLSSGPAINLGQAVSDDLNFWADLVNGLSSTAETNYLRQYLNDVIN